MTPTIRQPGEGMDRHIAFAITLMEHLVVPTFVLDADQRVLIWNRACERLTGVLAQEVVGTRDHWKAFYSAPRPCLADLVATSSFDQISALYTVHDNAGEPGFGVHAENWCWVPRRGQRLYLAVDAGPVFDEDGNLIAVVETLRDITEKQIAQTKVMEQAGILKAHYDEHQQEAELARNILEHQVRQDLMRPAGVRHSVVPANHFSGDMVLAAVSPSGRRYAVLADATGHGLAAAVSILPMAQEFYRRVEHSQPLPMLVEGIGYLLRSALPMGRFVAAAFVCIDEQAGEGQVWVGGMPEVLLLDGEGLVMRRFASRGLPLGISATVEVADCVEHFHWSSDSRLLLVSDGVIERQNPAGEQFGAKQLEDAVAHVDPESLIEAVQAAVNIHAGGEAAQDDMSVLVVDPAP